MIRAPKSSISRVEYYSSNNAVVINDKISNEICIYLHSYEENKFILVVSDNGIGLPETINFTNTNTLGLQLVNSLVGQLDGTIELDRTNGTQFKIIFNKLGYRN